MFNDIQIGHTGHEADLWPIWIVEKLANQYYQELVFYPDYCSLVGTFRLLLSV